MELISTYSCCYKGLLISLLVLTFISHPH